MLYLPKLGMMHNEGKNPVKIKDGIEKHSGI